MNLPQYGRMPGGPGIFDPGGFYDYWFGPQSRERKRALSEREQLDQYVQRPPSEPARQIGDINQPVQNTPAIPPSNAGLSFQNLLAMAGLQGKQAEVETQRASAEHQRAGSESQRAGAAHYNALTAEVPATEAARRAKLGAETAGQESGTRLSNEQLRQLLMQPEAVEALVGPGMRNLPPNVAAQIYGTNVNRDLYEAGMKGGGTAPREKPLEMQDNEMFKRTLQNELMQTMQVTPNADPKEILNLFNVYMRDPTLARSFTDLAAARTPEERNKLTQVIRDRFAEVKSTPPFKMGAGGQTSLPPTFLQRAPLMSQPVEQVQEPVAPRRPMPTATKPNIMELLDMIFNKQGQ